MTRIEKYRGPMEDAMETEHQETTPENCEPAGQEETETEDRETMPENCDPVGGEDGDITAERKALKLHRGRKAAMFTRSCNRADAQIARRASEEELKKRLETLHTTLDAFMEANEEFVEKLQDRCSMCGATPRNVNKLDEVRRLPVTNLEYGLSSLHCWIRIFEAVLHISYRLPIEQWQAVSSCLPLSPESLEAYCNETAELYVEHYGWYPMPTTLHRLLVHAAAVVQQCLLPIGTMSEEAAEARHKHVRLYRLQRARRDSRLHTMADIFGRLMITSDPVISTKSASSRRQARASSRMPLLKEARALLAEPTLPQNDSRTSDDSSDDDSSGCDSEAP
ncbi:hypothetical protein FJT64_001828 [Amphibalanus amphitrite]|uniref:Uncharacterized protein n=1 Tax=Amphibalanus amphitrite TaxID=1232801 RepID=A0A6A4WVW5_AMPAM|nr:hypothetical protein FJT64_001828 [Amphibalanus amphitrite]